MNKFKFENTKEIEALVENLWNQYSDIFSGIKSERYNINKELNQTENYCMDAIYKTIPFSIRKFEEAIHFMYSVYKLIYKIHDLAEEKKYTVVSLIYVSRLCNLLVSIKKLIISGYEEPARILSRTYIEAADICLVTFNNTEFSLEMHALMENEDIDAEEEFWKRKIGFGRINKELELLINNTNLGSEFIEEYVNNKKELKSFFSKSIHSSMKISVNSFLIPSGYSPDKFEYSVLGGFSDDTEVHLHDLFAQVYFFSYLILHFIMRERPSVVFENTKDVDQELNNVFASYLVLRDLYFEDKIEDFHNKKDSV